MHCEIDVAPKKADKSFEKHNSNFGRRKGAKEKQKVSEIVDKKERFDAKLYVNI